MSLADQLDAHLGELARRDAFPGVVLVTRGTTIEYEGAFGLASRAWKVPNTMDTRFDTASITKLFTVAAVLQLIDAGLLSFDTEVVEHLGLRDTTISPRANVFHLLTHSSGIGDDADEEAGEQYEDIWRTKPNYTVVTTTDFLPQFVHRPANFEPGRGARYNNVGFVLLGLCVEQATGTSYRDYVCEHVFGRAGMERSGFFRMDEVSDAVAEGADPVVDDSGAVIGWRRNIYSFPPIGSPDGGAHVTAGDLDRFMGAARNAELFSPELTAMFLTPHVFHSATDTRIVRYGLGLEFVTDLDDRLLYVEKEGYNVGVSGVVRYYPADDRTVTVLSNTGAGAWQPMRDIDAMVGNHEDRTPDQPPTNDR